MSTPDEQIHHRTCSLCEGMCGLEIRVKDGRVDKIRADTEVVFAWSGARGTCDSLVIDMTQETLSAKGLARPAVIQLPNANLTARQVNYNYRTKMYTCWSGKFKLMPTTK